MQLATVTLVLVGCGGGGGSSNPDMATPVMATDKQVCDNACATMIGCGILYDSTCSPNCLKAPVFLACARTAGSDCNALVLCSYQQYSAINCGGGGAGVPQGAGTCNNLRVCNANCIDTHAGAACYCGCLAALNPSLAINSLIDSQCSFARCQAPCMVSSASCLSCQMQSCSAQAAQCENN
jgi:hypothetical protein